jgi:predicted transposase YbfD/YdcC
MSATKPVSIRKCFADLPDPRREHGRLHNLWDIIAITILAVIGNADSWVDVATYGVLKLDFLKTFLDLPNGIPSHDTFNRVFAVLDPLAFQQCFANWMQSLAEITEGRLIAIDGKTLRHSFDKAAGKGPLHMLGAWAEKNHLLLAQQAVDKKSNEITAIPELLKTLEISGAIITIDAMGCQKTIAEQIDTAGADYVLGLKGNQETLHNDARELFTNGLENNFADMEHHVHRTFEKGHGRTETRTYHVIPVPENLKEKHADWKGLRSFGMVFSERQVGDQEPSLETRFFILSLRPKVKVFANAVRSHWGIENGLHWILDISFREDESRLHKDHGPENLALIRRLAVSLLRNETGAKVGVACKRKTAGWSNDYLLKVLAANLK